MIAKKIHFTMVFGQSMEGFAMTPGSIEYYPGCKPTEPSGPPSDAAGPAGGPPKDGSPAPGASMPMQEFELTMTEQDGVLKGILKSEHGCQKIDDIVESPFSLSFTAFSGSEGVEVFRYVLLFSDSTAQIIGFTCGVKPFFRSYMPLTGKILEQ